MEKTNRLNPNPRTVSIDKRELEQLRAVAAQLAEREADLVHYQGELAGRIADLLSEKRERERGIADLLADEIEWLRGRAEHYGGHFRPTFYARSAHLQNRLRALDLLPILAAEESHK
jgi:hypothetical protein